MAAGDVKASLQQIAAGGTLTIQPASGEEWVIHNLYYSAQLSMRITSGGNTISFDSDTVGGARLGLAIHVTNTQYIQLFNSSGGVAYFGYDGIQTK